MNTKQYDIIVLYSGGLDSKLAIKLLSMQGLSVLAVKFLHPFSPGLQSDKENFYRDEMLDADVLETPTDDKYLEIIPHPQHGYGSNANPCLDCKIHFLRRAWELAQKYNIKGIATGEVLGQRPFSQRAEAMKLIENKAGLSGKVIRPLCAKLLPASEAEIMGIVDRSRLLDIRGRGRKRQMELAKQFEIGDYPTPAGGCLLTDPGYSIKLFDAMKHNEFSAGMTQLLKFGRHFRIEGKRVVISRDAEEETILRKHFALGRILLEPTIEKGPMALVNVDADTAIIDYAGQIIARYIRKGNDSTAVEIQISRDGNVLSKTLASPANAIWVDEHLIR